MQRVSFHPLSIVGRFPNADSALEMGGTPISDKLFCNTFGMGNPTVSFLVSLILSMGLGIPAAFLAERLRLMDIPESAPHKKHSRPVPLAGGILMILVFGGMALFFRASLNRDILVVLAGAMVILGFGLWDDLKGLSAMPKLIGQLLASFILIGFGVQVRFMTILFGPDALPYFVAQAFNILLTLFWLIGITNALNMIDSMDGIVAGLGVIASVFFWGATNAAGQTALSFWSASLMGVSIGLYLWNGLAARFFLGDSGAQTMGFLLASLGILYNPLDRSPESSWIVPIMLLGVPIFDTTLVVLSRLRRRQQVGSGRRDHTYHRLIALGLSPKVAVLLTHLAALSISAVAFLTLSLPAWLALVFFIVTIFCGLVFLLWLERKPTLDDLPGENTNVR